MTSPMQLCKHFRWSTRELPEKPSTTGKGVFYIYKEEVITDFMLITSRRKKKILNN